MAMNKRGIFFTTIALLIGGLLVLYFVGLTESRYTSNLPIIEHRVLSINEYMNDLEDTYFERIILVAGHRAFYSLAEYIDQQNSFIPDVETQFINVLVFGEIYADNIDTLLGGHYMENYTLAYRIEELEEVTNKKLKINTDFILEDIRVYQDTRTGPWAIGVEADFNYTINSTVANWNRSVTINVTLPIENMIDPLYTIATNGQYYNVFHKSVYDDAWDTANTSEHLNLSTYAFDTHAPSLLGRYKGDFTASDCCGVESLVNLYNLVGIASKNASAVDYCFFAEELGQPERCIAGDYGYFIWKIEDITTANPYFRLDSYHVEKYNVTVQAFNAGCYYNTTTKTWSGEGCV